jgi:hypothetical protein
MTFVQLGMRLDRAIDDALVAPRFQPYPLSRMEGDAIMARLAADVGLWLVAPLGTGTGDMSSKRNVSCHRKQMR